METKEMQERIDQLEEAVIHAMIFLELLDMLLRREDPPTYDQILFNANHELEWLNDHGGREIKLDRPVLY